MNDVLLVVVVIVALGFDFTNGFHDTANAVATSVSTRALSPRLAVAVAAVANLAGVFETGHISHFYIPTWVIVAAGLAIGAGTYVGGWRIMRTLGQRVFSMQPESGFAAQITAGVTIYTATKLGYPLSTTHVISGSVMGAGATKRLSAVRWGVAGNIVSAWILTIPAAGLVAAACYWPVVGIF